MKHWITWRNYQWLVFYQPYRCRVFFEELIRHGKDIRAMGKCMSAVIGEGTAKRPCKKEDFWQILCRKYMTEMPGKELSEILSGGEKILIPRARKGQ